MSTLLDTASLIVTPNGYKAGKLYSVVPSSGAGDLDVTRATTATRVNSSGLIESVGANIPRLDYSNGSCPSILVEPQRTNLALRSQEFDNSHWVKFNGATITANTITSPDGTINADTLNTASSQEIYASMGAKAIGSITYTFSCFAKYSNASELQIQASDFATSASIGYFNLQTGIATFTQGSTWSGTSVKMENYGNGWYRCIMTSTSPVTPALYVSLLTTASGSAYIYGTQTEQGSYATSYIPTTSASVTRNADVISKTGISSLIGTEFTLFLDAYETIGGTSTRYVVLKGSGGTYANAVFLEANTSNQIVLTILNSSSATVFGGISSALTSGQRFKLAVRCKNNDFAFYVNGAQVATQTSGSVPTTSDLYLGYYSDYSDNYNTINSSAIWQSALTNTQLEQLTTL